uniref:MCoCC-1 n=1 Tax=Momordica cochinchinensis TaxID=3674 RepID=D0VWX1_MOMCO|nr:Chain A, MCoCC-1 [Momordica cochinchinensis]
GCEGKQCGLFRSCGGGCRCWPTVTPGVGICSSS